MEPTSRPAGPLRMRAGAGYAGRTRLGRPAATASRPLTTNVSRVCDHEVACDAHPSRKPVRRRRKRRRHPASLSGRISWQHAILLLLAVVTSCCFGRLGSVVRLASLCRPSRESIWSILVFMTSYLLLLFRVAHCLGLPSVVDSSRCTAVAATLRGHPLFRASFYRATPFSWKRCGQ